MLTGVSSGAGAHVFVERLQVASGAVQARGRVARVLERDLAEARCKSDGAGASERWRTTPDAFLHPARTTVLAPWARVAGI